MPSQVSLQKHQYYGHPRNAFWWIMGQLYDFAVDAPYAHRMLQLTGSRVAVWDVLMECERSGSLDSNIIQGSEKVNDFATLIQEVPSIKLIAFNGAAAKQIFMRHCTEILTANPMLEWVQLPSTSPAHAAMTKTQKLQIWRDALNSR